MRFLSLLALATSATAAAIPDGLVEERATSCATAGASTIAAAKAAFTSAKLVPDLIPSFNPDVAVAVNYNGKQVQLGNTFNTLGESRLQGTHSQRCIPTSGLASERG